MSAVRQRMRALLADDSGATAIEYGLIAALIVIALIGALSALGGGTTGGWTKLSQDVTNASSA